MHGDPARPIVRSEQVAPRAIGGQVTGVRFERDQAERRQATRVRVDGQGSHLVGGAQPDVEVALRGIVRQRAGSANEGKMLLQLERSGVGVHGPDRDLVFIGDR